MFVLDFHIGKWAHSDIFKHFCFFFFWIRWTCLENELSGEAEGQVPTCFSEMPSLSYSLFVGAFVSNGAAVPARLENAHVQERNGRFWDTFSDKMRTFWNWKYLESALPPSLARENQSYSAWVADLFRPLDELPIVIRISGDTRQSWDVSIKQAELSYRFSKQAIHPGIP